MQLFNKLRSILEDRRPSHEVGPLGAPFFVVEITPATLQEEHVSPAKREFMDVLLDILKESPVTSAMKSHILEEADVLFDFGLPADYTLSLTIGLVDQGEWALFDPTAQPKHEQGTLDAAIKTLYLNMIGAQLVFLSQEQEDQLSTKDARDMFLSIFAPEQEWPTVAQLSEFFERMGGPVIRFQWSRFFRRASNLVRWIEEYRSHWGDSGAFQDEEPTLRRLASYGLTLRG